MGNSDRATKHSLSNLLPIVQRIKKRTIGFTFGAFSEFRGRPIAAPSPPSATAFAMVKLLPFALLAFAVDRRSSINPNILGRFNVALSTGGTVETVGMNCFFGPTGRRG